MKKGKSSLLGGESYVLRLYRRLSEASGLEVIGLLEDPLHGQQWPFHSMQELELILEAQWPEERAGTEI